MHILTNIMTKKGKLDKTGLRIFWLDFFIKVGHDVKRDCLQITKAQVAWP